LDDPCGAIDSDIVVVCIRQSETLRSKIISSKDAKCTIMVNQEAATTGGQGKNPLHASPTLVHEPQEAETDDAREPISQKPPAQL